MEKGWIIGIAIVVAVVIFWQVSQSPEQPLCSSPYIQVGNSCCLDENSNSICDSDEVQGPYCGDGICQLNENAPDCRDCKTEIRIENLEYEILKPKGQYVELAIPSYDVVQLGDKSVVYPSFDIYTGYSEQQCENKDSMELFTDDFGCPGGCYYVVDGDKKDKSYREDGTQLVKIGSFDNPSCTYFIFELKPYPKGGIGRNSGVIEPIASWESGIINI